MPALHKKILCLVILLFVALPLLVGAQEAGLADPDSVPGEGTYVLLEEIPGFIDNSSAGSFGGFLSGAYKLGVAVATALAVLMIVVGGVRYMGGESFFSKSDAKDQIWWAIGGLVLALGSFIVLQTINPNLVEFDIVKTLESVRERVREQALDPVNTLPPPDGGEEAAIRLQLAQHQILAHGPCGTSPCANLVGLGSAIGGVIDLKNTCDTYAPPRTCSIFITGGTEPGHQSHGVGRPILDLRKDTGLNQYVVNNASEVVQTPIGPLYKIGNDEYVDEGNHWHVCYNMRCPINGRPD